MAPLVIGAGPSAIAGSAGLTAARVNRAAMFAGIKTGTLVA